MVTKWDKRFMEVAVLVSSWSKDPDNQVGAVLTTPDNRIISTGFNGLPKNIEAYTPNSKLAKTIHAEVNCIIQASSLPVGCTIYVTRFPCSQCAALIVQTGISRVVCHDMEPGSTWYPSMIVATELLSEANIVIQEM